MLARNLKRLHHHFSTVGQTWIQSLLFFIFYSSWLLFTSAHFLLLGHRCCVHSLTDAVSCLANTHVFLQALAPKQEILDHQTSPTDLITMKTRTVLCKCISPPSISEIYEGMNSSFCTLSCIFLYYLSCYSHLNAVFIGLVPICVNLVLSVFPLLPFMQKFWQYSVCSWWYFLCSIVKRC